MFKRIVRYSKRSEYHCLSKKKKKKKERKKERKMYMCYVRTRFGSLTQKVDGLKPKKPKTMNLYRVGWKTGL